LSPLDQPDPTSDWQPLEKEKERSKKLRWLMISIAVAVVVVIGFLYYYISLKKGAASSSITTADQTADWKIYENKVYGYSIKYDKTWQLSDEDDADVKFLSEQNPDPTLAGPQKVILEIKSSSAPSASYDDWFNELSLKSSKSQSILVGGKDGKEIIQGKITQIFLIADSMRYQIIQQDVTTEDFLKAVKTFSLIVQSEPKPPSSFSKEVVLAQTYTNETYHYIIKYPPNWVVSPASNNPSAVLDEEDFRNLGAGLVLFYVKVTNLALSDEIKSYKESLGAQQIIQEGSVAAAETTGTRIVTKVDTLENTATFLVKNNKTYVLWGKSKDSSYQLFYSQMVASMEFTK
jgi:hypothetical protein